ncbi:hypothetical protein ACFSKU_14590 [Pontibacter silvestris]|uniref:Uncharacterized protein n=2 Tax=Pontibacter silvestris TaxID=2305183 RepID=A0ABW4WZP5_9BACT
MATMGNKAFIYSDSYFWRLQERYSGFALQKIKTHLQHAGHRGIVFHYQLLSMGLLLKTFRKTPRLNEIITAFEGAYSFNRKTAPSNALRAARQVNLEGLCELAGLYVDTYLENMNEEAFRYWGNNLQRLEQQGNATPHEDNQRERVVAKFLVKYYTLMSQLRHMEPDFTLEKIRVEAANSRALDQGERDNEAIEAIGRMLYPELFNKEQQKETNKQMDIATKGNGLDMAALGLERHEWLGTQKELAELFIELERKGWIREKKVETIQATFTKSDTIDQIMKPNRDHKYPEIFTPAYRPRFDGIKQKVAAKKRK